VECKTKLGEPNFGAFENLCFSTCWIAPQAFSEHSDIEPLRWNIIDSKSHGMSWATPRNVELQLTCRACAGLPYKDLINEVGYGRIMKDCFSYSRRDIIDTYIIIYIYTYSYIFIYNENEISTDCTIWKPDGKLTYSPDMTYWMCLAPDLSLWISRQLTPLGASAKFDPMVHGPPKKRNMMRQEENLSRIYCSKIRK